MWQSAYGKDCQNIQLQHKVTFSLTHLKEEEIGYSGKALVVVGDLTDHQQVVCRNKERATHTGNKKLQACKKFD